VRPRRRGSEFELNRHGWQVSETVRAQRTTSAEFFKKPLQEWAQDGSGKSVLGPGLALRSLKSPNESVAEAPDGAEDVDGRKEQRDSCGDTCWCGGRLRRSEACSGCSRRTSCGRSFCEWFASVVRGGIRQRKLSVEHLRTPCKGLC
jgi:hypothetical protein